MRVAAGAATKVHNIIKTLYKPRGVGAENMTCNPPATVFRKCLMKF